MLDSCFSTGWLSGVAAHHPVLAFPIVTLVSAVCLQYYNLTLSEAAWLVISWIGSGVFTVLQWVQVLTGDPSPNAIVFILLIYVAVIIGISSAFGCAFAIWRFVINMVGGIVRFFFARPISFIRAASRECEPVPLERSLPVSLDSHRTLPTQAMQVSADALPPSDTARDIIDSNKTSGIDSGSDHSSTSSPPTPPAPIPVISDHDLMAPTRVCQAHLIRMDRFDGTALPNKPCQGEKNKMAHLLNADWFSQHGTRVLTHDGPVSVYLCSKRRLYYDGRLAEFKCQYKCCFDLGILMEFRGMKILECPVHLQMRLDQSPAQVADDLLSMRLTTKRRCQDELHDRVLDAQVTEKLSHASHPEGEQAVLDNGMKPRKLSSSSEVSIPVMPDLKRVLSGDDVVRSPPAPSPPI